MNLKYPRIQMPEPRRKAQIVKMPAGNGYRTWGRPKELPSWVTHGYFVQTKLLWEQIYYRKLTERDISEIIINAFKLMEL